MKRMIFLALACCGMAFGALERDASKIAEVASGSVLEGRLKWWGFQESDSTAIIREALSSGVKTLIVDKMESPWVTLPVELPGGMTLIFEEGAEWLAKRGEFKGGNDCLVSVRGKKHVKIIGKGKGGILRMWKCDYLQAPYKKAEWRHALSLLSAEDVLVEKMLMASSGGDGIYISRMRGKDMPGYCKDVTIRKCVCDDNNRQGISVIGAVNLLIEDTVLSNTKGTAPQAGIDFEPNQASEPLVNCVMRRCIAENNASTGFAFYLPNMDSRQSGAYSIRLEDCISRHDGGNGFSFCSRSRHQSGNIWEGTVEFVNCTAENSGRHGLAFTVDMADKMTAKVQNMRIIGGGWCERRYRGKPNYQLAEPVVIDYNNQVEGHVGSTIELDNLAIEDTRDIPWLKVSDNAFCGVDEYRISGNVTRIVGGETTQIAVNGDYLKGLYPDRRYMKVTGWDDSNRQYSVEPQGKVPTAPGMRLRNCGTYWLYATEGQPLEFALKYLAHGKGKKPDAKVELCYPSGKKETLGILSVSTKAGKKGSAFKVESALETGMCTVALDVAHNSCILESSSVPWGLVQRTNNGISLLCPKGTLYFRVEEGGPGASVRLAGQGEEGVKCEVVSPDGKVFWSQDVIQTCVECYLGDKPQAGVWGVRLDRPSRGVFEDCSVRLLGVAPYLGVSPDGVPRLVE